jgi:predicted GNAT family acetyltransferase
VSAGDPPQKYQRMRTLAQSKSLDPFGIGAHAEDMEVRFHRSVDEFRAVAEPLYRRDPVAHTIELTVLRSGALPDDSVLLTLWDNSEVVGAAMQTPPYPLSCNALPVESVDVVAAELARVRPELNSVRGVRDSAVPFADMWQAVTGRIGKMMAEERLYRLATLRSPSGVAGSHRPANDDDRGVLVDWVELFLSETFGHTRDTDAGERFIDTAKDKGDQFILWVADGEPVSMAMLRAPAAGVSRIGPVFTPRNQRGNGYGSAVTAAASELARRSGVTDVVLFADLANPTSNAIYQRIGFEPVADQVRIDFVTLG